MPLLFHVGTPMAATHFEPLSLAAASSGLRTVTYSRPGYGRSTRRPGHALADAAGDVRAILDRLGADRFVTLGWSGGGPRALACAAMLSDRCAAAIRPHDSARRDARSDRRGPDRDDTLNSGPRGSRAP